MEPDVLQCKYRGRGDVFDPINCREATISYDAIYFDSVGPQLDGLSNNAAGILALHDISEKALHRPRSSRAPRPSSCAGRPDHGPTGAP